MSLFVLVSYLHGVIFRIYFWDILWVSQNLKRLLLVKKLLQKCGV